MKWVKVNICIRLQFFLNWRSMRSSLCFDILSLDSIASQLKCTLYFLFLFSRFRLKLVSGKNERREVNYYYVNHYNWLHSISFYFWTKRKKKKKKTECRNCTWSAHADLITIFHKWDEIVRRRRINAYAYAQYSKPQTNTQIFSCMKFLLHQN